MPDSRTVATDVIAGGGGRHIELLIFIHHTYIDTTPSNTTSRVERCVCYELVCTYIFGFLVMPDFVAENESQALIIYLLSD